MTNNYDIFISYRRDNGEDKARILNQFLSTAGYRVFFDHESGMTGEFETEVLAAVEIAPVFLMLLTPNCLDRCNNEGDWVRREIERATKFGKVIIPIRPNYDESIFTNLPEGIPDYVMRLKYLEFAEIDFHKNFKATAQSMVDTQIKKLVQPSILLTGTGDKGTKIHFFSDISCRVLHFGKPIAVTDTADTSEGAIVRLLKGTHRLEYKSIEHEADAYSQVYDVPDNDYETFVNIELQPIKNRRKKKEEELKKVEILKAAEERALRINNTDNNYKYDVFFCYSRQDASVVRSVYQYLKIAGLRCWIDLDEIASVNYGDMIIEAIRQSKCLLYFSSEQLNSSPFATKEVIFTIQNNVRVLPIRLDDSRYSEDLMPVIGSIQMSEISLDTLFEPTMKLLLNRIVSNYMEKKHESWGLNHRDILGSFTFGSRSVKENEIWYRIKNILHSSVKIGRTY